MMKKVLLVVLCLMLAASVSMAQTSGPSNVAGYVKITCPAAGVNVQYATPFGLPFKFWDVVGGVPAYGVESTKPSDIVGDQANPGTSVTSDKIIIQGGDLAYRDAGNSNTWTGGLEDASAMVPGAAYWYGNKSGAVRNLVLAGEVDNAGNYGTTAIPDPPVSPANGNYATPYSWRDSRNVPVESLGLLEAGFTGGTTVTSDKVTEQGGYQLNYITATSTWDFGGEGEPFHYIVPGRAYWLVNKHPGHPWNYTYVGVPTLPSRMNDHEAVVTSAKRSNTETVKGAVRATTSVKKDASSKSTSKVRTNK